MEQNVFSKVIKEIKEMTAEGVSMFIEFEDEPIYAKFNKQNRSVKQIAGHMIDSASNNLHRIIHLQYNETPLVFPNYATCGNNDRWIALQNYQEEDWALITQLWKYLHLHLVHVIENINVDKLDNTWIAANDTEISLRDMVNDFPRHMRLHLDEIFDLYNS